jgi:hypothetical protein
MSVKERIKEYILYKNLNVSKFEKLVGLSNGYVNSIVSSISTKKLEEISRKFPDLNKNWLLFGEGKMITVLPNAEEVKTPDGTEVILTMRSGNEFIDTEGGSSYMLVPLVDYYAYGGYLSGWNDPAFIEDLPKHMISVEAYHKGVYRAFVVKGDSMNNGLSDALIEGDILTGRVVEKELWSSRFHIHQYKYFIIVHKEGILVKTIIDHDVENGGITVSSLNPDKINYPDQKIFLKDVYELLNVVDLNRKTRFN